MKATEATANAAGNFIKAKGLDVANKVMGNPAALAGGLDFAADFTSSFIDPVPPSTTAFGYLGSKAKETFDSLSKDKGPRVEFEKKNTK